MINPVMYLLLFLGALAVWLALQSDWTAIGKKVWHEVTTMFIDEKKDED